MWVAVFIASLVALVIFVLCVPVGLALRMDASGRPRFSVRLAWFFGLVSTELKEEKKKAKVEERKAEGKKEREHGKGNARLVFEALRTRGLLKRLFRLLRDILSRLKFKELGGDLRVGLDNPADTGLLFAFVTPTSLLLNSSSLYDIRVQPSFAEGAVFEGYLYGAVRVWPIQLIPPLTGFVFSLPVVRAVKAVVVTKWKRRK